MRKECATRHNVMWRYHPVHERTSYSSNPTSCLAAAVAGHAKLATTAIYVQPNMQDLEAAVDSLMED
jgi:hypothetical protein